MQQLIGPMLESIEEQSMIGELADALEDYDACDVCYQHEHEYSVVPTQAMLDAWVKATEGFHAPKQVAA